MGQYAPDTIANNISTIITIAILLFSHMAKLAHIYYSPLPLHSQSTPSMQYKIRWSSSDQQDEFCTGKIIILRLLLLLPVLKPHRFPSIASSLSRKCASKTTNWHREHFIIMSRLLLIAHCILLPGNAIASGFHCSTDQNPSARQF